MELHFLGTGSAFTTKNFQTNIILKQKGKCLLIDAGGDLRFSLKEAGLSYKDIDSVYISHLHTDHAGGIEYLGFCTYFDPTTINKINLYGNGELIRKGWEDTWKGGMESIQGEIVNLESYFNVKPIKPNGKFVWEGLTFQTVQSIHIMNGYSIVPCYGLMITMENGKKVYFTSDCQFAPSQIMDFYKQADYIIQDCETSPFRSGVHAHFDELCTLPPEIKAKMILIHYQDNVLVNEGCMINHEWFNKAETNGFMGFAKRNNLCNFAQGETNV